MKTLGNRLRHWFGDLKLQSKITLVMALVATLPVIFIVLFFLGSFRDMLISDTIRKEQDHSARTAPLIDENIQKVLEAYSAITNHPFMQEFFQQPLNPPVLFSSGKSRMFSDSVGQILEADSLTGFQIYVDLPEDALKYCQNSEADRYISPLLSAKGTYWYGIFQGKRSLRELYCPSFYLGIQEQKLYGDMAYIRSTTVYYQGTAFPAYIALYYSGDSIREILVNNLNLEGSVSYILNERNALVASSDSSLSGIYWLNYESIEESFMSSNNFIERTILDNKVYAGFYRISKPGWFMVTVLPSTPLLRESNLIILKFWFFCLILLLLAFLMASYMTRSVTNRISSVISQMHMIRQGPPVPMESPVYHDEIGDLIDTYNYMARKIEQLLWAQQKTAEDLRIAEFSSLQAQINPHFLYNTMDMINWLAQQGRNAEVSTAVQSLSRFYKLTLSRRQSISSIAEEEEHVSIYVSLQNMRFHDKITFISDIPDELLDYQIPKLTLQPVIENAILHGILETEQKSGTIVLTGWMEEDDLVLMISDDGVGIPPDKLKTILTGSGKSSRGTNIAIYNTHQRFQLLYGDSYGLSYSSTPGAGTEVQIRLPALRTPSDV